MKGNPLEEALERTVASMQEVLDAVPEAEQPFNQRKLSRSEQMARYMETRDNPQAWTALIEEHGIRTVVEYARRMEEMIDKEIDRA